MSKDKKDQKKIYDLIIWERKQDKMTVGEEEENFEYVEIPVKTKEDTTENIGIVIIKAPNPLPGNPIVMFGHGNGETASDYTGYSIDFCPHGISICCVDYRGYGYSDGKYGSSSATEREDMITVYKYLKNNGFKKISYFGRSLGATCGLFVATEFPDLVCIALDSPWLSTREWTEFKAKSFDKIDNDRFKSLLPSVYKDIEEKTGLKFDEIPEPREVTGKIKQPFFLIHGDNDKLVPYSNSTELIELVKSKVKEFRSFKGGHNDFIRYKYYEEMFQFILEHNLL